MRIRNCSLDSARTIFQGRKIIFFGCGTWLTAINGTSLMGLLDDNSYVVDSNPKSNSVRIGSRTIDVYSVDKLREEIDCIVVLTSPVYMYDMYQQLVSMKLGDGVDCYAFPFMQMITPDTVDESVLKQVLNDKEQKIPKTIHSFWFSGEEKPEIYQKCVDSWHRVLPEYRIIEWNKTNYDWEKHPFMKRAIELKAWAFATDYARLDVIHEQGGLYLDMDVEVFKPFDSLLSCDGLLSFSNHIMVDLAVLGARPANPLIKRLRALYDHVQIPKEKEGFVSYFQPAYVRDEIIDSGFRMDGSLQRTDEATLFPREFFMPLDHVLFNSFERTDKTFCVHYDNFGWSSEKDNKRLKKMRDNRMLWDLIV